MIQIGFRVLKIGKVQFNFKRCLFGFERYTSRGPWRQFEWTLSLGIIQIRKWR